MTPFLEQMRVALGAGFTAPMAAFLTALEAAYAAQGQAFSLRVRGDGARINAPTGGVLFATTSGRLYFFPKGEWKPGLTLVSSTAHAEAMTPRPLWFGGEGKKGGLYFVPPSLTPEQAAGWVATLAARGLLNQGTGAGRVPVRAAPAPEPGIPQAPECPAPVEAAPTPAPAPAKPAKAGKASKRA